MMTAYVLRACIYTCHCQTVVGNANRHQQHGSWADAVMSSADVLELTLVSGVVEYDVSLV